MTNPPHLTFDQNIQNARKALDAGDRLTARRFAAQAAALEPGREEAWLILAQVGSANARRAYAERARECRQTRPTSVPVPPPGKKPKPAVPQNREKSSRRLLSILSGMVAVLALICLVGAALIWVNLPEILAALPSNETFPSLPTLTSQPTATEVAALQPSPIPSATPLPTATQLPTRTPLPTATPLPTSTPTARPSPTPPPTATPEPVKEPDPPEPVTYTVKRGDTMLKIAQRFGVDVTELVNLNHVPNPSSIKPGLTLTIPNGASAPVQPAAKPSSAQPASRPAASAGNRRILVDISEQHLWAYEGDQEVFSFVASTGRNNWTLTGTFRIQSKIPNAWSGWGFWMPYWMGIYWVGTAENGIHSLPVLTNGKEIWGDEIGTPISYGCVVLSPDDSRRLYEWATIGTPIEIRR